MKKITMTDMMKAMFELEREENLKCTLLGIGPMSPDLIEASFLLAREKDFPLMFIASRNQVDADELGGGYVCNWDQYRFVDDISKISSKTGFEGLYYICRDHGGPWQRDNERNEKLPPEKAMQLAKESYLADLLAGFDLLHIDPTKNPHYESVVPIDLVLDYTVELIEYIESERKKRDLPPVAYEVGTEETNGGLTSVDIYMDFIKELNSRLSAKGLPSPVFIVGQTGTLTRNTENIGHFDGDTAQRLSDAAKKYSVGLKEHNGDYLSEKILYMHPLLGITATNVAPEFGVVETRACLMLADIENYMFERNRIKEKSNFVKTIQQESIKSGRWKKWLGGELANLSLDDILKDEKISHLITEICGHYTFDNPAVKQERMRMYNNLSELGLNPHEIVISNLKKSIGKYVECFNLSGLTTRIKNRIAC